jgi:hypothetical protein
MMDQSPIAQPIAVAEIQIHTGGEKCRRRKPSIAPWACNPFRGAAILVYASVGTGVIVASLVAGSSVGFAQAPQPSVQERVGTLKTTLAASQANMRQYEWIETTVLSLKGEEKSRKQQRCYYGADGLLQKIVVEASPPPDQKRGLRGRIVANKTAELTDYLQNAVSMVKAYVPPDPIKIQTVKDAGKVTIDVLEPGKLVRVNFRDYQKAGDNLGVEIELANNRIARVTVATYLEAAADVVKLTAHMSHLNDGTAYASDIVLNAPAKNLTVTVQNTGYRKTGGP